MIISEIAEKLINKVSSLEGAIIKSIVELAGDASGRQYFRISLDKVKIASVILMKSTKATGPISTAKSSITQDYTFIEVGTLLQENGLPVPSILAPFEEYLLIQDVGDVALWQFAYQTLDENAKKINSILKENATLKLYKKSIDFIKQLQNIPTKKDHIAFKRRMGILEYETESLRFIDHYMKPNDFSSSSIKTVKESIVKLCKSVSEHPHKLMHRDFMPWNIHIAQDGEIQVIDFQDCCLGSTTYDIVSLIHDRDTDFELGSSVVEQLLSYYQEVMEEDSSFRKRYHDVLLQRHFRLAGQFTLLTQKTGREIYKNWVPGCLKRIGRSLAQIEEMDEVFNILKSVPEIKDGAADPWPKYND